MAQMVVYADIDVSKHWLDVALWPTRERARFDSALGWEHINLTGDYVWDTQQSMSEKAAAQSARGIPKGPRDVPAWPAYGVPEGQFVTSGR